MRRIARRKIKSEKRTALRTVPRNWKLRYIPKGSLVPEDQYEQLAAEAQTDYVKVARTADITNPAAGKGNITAYMPKGTRQLKDDHPVPWSRLTPIYIATKYRKVNRRWMLR